jgi:hypothetical protein
LVAAFIDAAGRLAIAWVTETNPWNAAIPISGPIGLTTTGSGIALGNQTDTIATAGFFDANGQFQVATSSGAGWTLAPPPPGVTAAPGAPLALSRQAGDIFTCAYFDPHGALTVSSVSAAGPWRAPSSVGGLQAPNVAPRIALGRQHDDLLTAGFIDTIGVLTLAWVEGDSAWNPAVHV